MYTATVNDNSTACATDLHPLVMSVSGIDEWDSNVGGSDVDGRVSLEMAPVELVLLSIA